MRPIVISSASPPNVQRFFQDFSGNIVVVVLPAYGVVEVFVLKPFGCALKKSVWMVVESRIRIGALI
jgi:hypothetical protein